MGGATGPLSEAGGARRDIRTRRVRGSVVRAGHGLIVIGSETSGGIRNSEFYNLRGLADCSEGIRFKSASNRGGVVENISIHDIVMEGVPTPISMQGSWNPSYSYATLPEGMTETPERWKPLLEPVPPEKGIPHFRNVRIVNVKATGARQAFAVTGLEQAPFLNFVLENVDIEAQQGGAISNAENWIFDNVVVRTPEGTARPTETNTRNMVWLR